MMKIDRIEQSKHRKGRILVFLEDGTLLKCTEQELLSFGLRAGDELDELTFQALKKEASGSSTKADAAALIGRRAMSRADLEKKLVEKGASQREAVYAAEWLEAIGALNDADYAAMLVRHCANLYYGPSRYQEELRCHGIDRSLWEEACTVAPSPQELIERYLADRFRTKTVNEQELRRASAALARRGFSWGDVKEALHSYLDQINYYE